MISEQAEIFGSGMFAQLFADNPVLLFNKSFQLSQRTLQPVLPSGPYLQHFFQVLPTANVSGSLAFWLSVRQSVEDLFGQGFSTRDPRSGTKSIPKWNGDFHIAAALIHKEFAEKDLKWNENIWKAIAVLGLLIY